MVQDTLGARVAKKLKGEVRQCNGSGLLLGGRLCLQGFQGGPRASKGPPRGFLGLEGGFLGLQGAPRGGRPGAPDELSMICR